MCEQDGSRVICRGHEQTCLITKKSPLYWNASQICAFAERLTAAESRPAICELSWVTGFAFFTRRSLWQERGGFDQQLADYSNEIELCTRAAKARYRTVWVRSSYVHHFGGQSYRKLMSASEIGLQNLAGMEYVRDKHNPRLGQI